MISGCSCSPAPRSWARRRRRRRDEEDDRVGDNYYAPKTVTVAKGTTVTWNWPGFEEAGDVHDVKLKSGPKGVKKFHSEAAATDYSFKRKLTVAGTYKIVCTLHEEMTHDDQGAEVGAASRARAAAPGPSS